MIRNLNSIRNQFKDIESASDEYTENDVAFMGCAMDTVTNETTTSYIGGMADFFYMMSSMCISFYENSPIKKEFTPEEFADYIRDGLVKSFNAARELK